MRRRATPLLAPAVLGLLGAGLAVGASPASAERVVVNDPADDIWTYITGPDGPEWVRGDGAENDIRKVVVGHDAGGVHLEARYAALPPRQSNPANGMRFVVDRSRGRDLVAAVSTGADGPGLRVTDDRGERVRGCSGRRAELDLDRPGGIIEVTLFHACLGEQRWVRVSTASATVSGRFVSTDGAGTGGYSEDVYTKRVSAR